LINADGTTRFHRLLPLEAFSQPHLDRKKAKKGIDKENGLGYIAKSAVGTWSLKTK
jgi:hypothetical protein